MIKALFAILFALNAQVSAQEPVQDTKEASEDFLNQDPFLSDRYIKGAYLLYDCEEEHWVCTGEAEFKRCEEWREQDLARKEEEFRCANFLSFKTIEKCHEKQISMMPARYPARFCLTPNTREAQVHY